jgi:hypothetical protein
MLASSKNDSCPRQARTYLTQSDHRDGLPIAGTGAIDKHLNGFDAAPFGLAIAQRFQAQPHRE